MGIIKLNFLLTVFLISTFISSKAYACAVCGFGEDSRYAFISTTALLTFVPLIMIGSIFYWVYRRAKQVNNNEDDFEFSGTAGTRTASNTNPTS
ncbi:MAG: hypothetical protein R3B45_08180 [Bdellovibrionota bacterium]